MLNFSEKMPDQIKDQLRVLPPGLMFYTISKNSTDKNSEGSFTLIIKDEAKRINKLKSVIQFRSIVTGHSIKNVLIIDLLIKFDDIKDTIYECFINPKDNDLGEIALRRILENNKIYIIFVNEYNQICRKIVVLNSMKKTFKKIQIKLLDWFWTDKDFMEAKEIFLNETKANDLWNKYTKNKP